MRTGALWRGAGRPPGGSRERSIRTEAGPFSGLAPDRALGIACQPGQAVARPGAFFALAGHAAGELS